MTKTPNRLAALNTMPLHAALDHRHFLNDDNEDARISAMPRKERKRIQSEAKKIAHRYADKLRSIKSSGIGYEIDQTLRRFSIEYTHRYAASGAFNQPMSFNYIEPFCNIAFLADSVAPFAEPRRESNHLFTVTDFFEWLTSDDMSLDAINSLKDLREGHIFHYTQNGAIDDFAYATPDGRDFFTSGFSLIRHGESIHWCLVGGELYSEQDWEDLLQHEMKVSSDYTPEHKRAFLEEAIREHGATAGPPIVLDGTEKAQRTIIAGETDLVTRKHLNRCYMREFNNTFVVICDDPYAFAYVEDEDKRKELEEQRQKQLSGAALMWSLAEAFFALPLYFAFRINLSKEIVVKSGLKTPITKPKGGAGIGSNFHYVATLEISDSDGFVISSYKPPHYQVDTSGHWRKIQPKNFGTDMHGNQVLGKTWVRTNKIWRERSDWPREVYVKSTVTAAKIKRDIYLSAAANEDASLPLLDQEGVVYVLRCMAMEADIFKIGFTTLTAKARAEQLSAETGVPNAFVVVNAWAHRNPELLEEGIHARLAPYRLNEQREFFQAKYSVIENAINAEVARCPD